MLGGINYFQKIALKLPINPPTSHCFRNLVLEQTSIILYTESRGFGYDSIFWWFFNFTLIIIILKKYIINKVKSLSSRPKGWKDNFQPATIFSCASLPILNKMYTCMTYICIECVPIFNFVRIRCTNPLYVPLYLILS